MIDTPVTAKFFKKLELYLELKRQNKRSKKSDRGMTWQMEKSFLLWAIRGHWHMGTPLNSKYVEDRLREAGFSTDWTKYKNQVMQNLVFKEFARYYPEGADSIQITDKGFLMAEVIEETDSKMEYVYILFMIAVWLIVVWGFLEVLNKVVMVIKNIVSAYDLSLNNIGIVLNLAGTIFIAFSFGSYPDKKGAPYTSDNSGRKKFIAYFNYPNLFYCGLILLIIGFALQLKLS